MKKYRTGTIISVAKREVLLALVDSHKCCLIDMTDGNRWNNPLEVECADGVTVAEIKKMARPYAFHIVRERI